MTTRKLHIQMFSIHGLIRGESPELGRDADTGGQVKYVLELTRALSAHPEVERVDLITRLIQDKTVAKIYGKEIEPLNDKANIIRIRCGGRKYIRKELLWPHLDSFVDETLKFIKSQGRIPDFFHGHYADGGYVAQQLASIFGRPFIFTGHSMGRHKKNKLLAEGLSPEEIDRRYHIDHRIGVEERIIKEAEQIIASTSHEVNLQYGLYENHGAGRFVIVPPGIDIDKFFPYYDHYLDNSADAQLLKQARMALLHELHRFWVHPHKPFILALCRPDHRKNISGLITAYGEDKDLQAIANLAIFAGIRKNITIMEDNERNVLTEMLLLMDRYDLYGRMAIPKKHDFTLEVPELYRLCADSHGIFVNPALVEPFGLTLIEAAASGLPIIATHDGGPADIIGNCDNGVLIDPTSPKEIAAAAKRILVDHETWERYSTNGINGVRRHYSWSSHCEKTLRVFGKVARRMPEIAPQKTSGEGIGHRFTHIGALIFTDIDNTLVGDDRAMRELLDLLARHQSSVAWGVATGRCLDMTLEALNEYAIPRPDLIISSVGTEIYYGPGLTPDHGWQQHLAYRWHPEEIRETLAGLEFLAPQEPETQRRFKISYYMEDDPDLLALVHQSLRKKRLRYNLVFSNNQFLDILPYRASKGKAIRYLSYKWEIPLAKILVCGDSGNDEDMLRGNTSAVVVANYSDELEKLRGLRRTFFSSREFAAGIIDGIRHYRLLEEEKES